MLQRYFIIRDLQPKNKKLRIWRHNEKILQGDRSFVNFVTRQGIDIISIYQRFDELGEPWQFSCNAVFFGRNTY